MYINKMSQNDSKITIFELCKYVLITRLPKICLHHVAYII